MATPASSISLHVATSTDDSGLTKTTTSLKTTETASDGLAVSLGRVAMEAGKMEGALAAGAAGATKHQATHATLSQEMEKAGRSTQTFGEKALAAAYFADDLQYGIKGILNNIPMLAMSLGMGSGVAGIVSILAVGFSVLSDKMGWFQEEAGSSADELKKLATETQAAATAATKEATATDAAEAALKAHNKRVQEAEERYKELTTAIDEAAKSRGTMAKNITAEKDAEAALALARIEQRRALQGGQGGADQEAEKDSNAIKKDIARKKFEADQAEAAAKEADLRAKAKALSDAAAAKDAAASNLGAGSGGLMDSEGRKAAEARKKEADAALAQAEAEAAKQKETIARMGTNAYGQQGPSIEIVRNPAYDKAQADLKAARDSQAAADKALGRDGEAKGRTGFTDADALRAEVERLQKESNAARAEAARMAAEAARIQSTRNTQSRVFGMDQERADIESGIRVAGFDSRDEATAQKEKETAAKNRGKNIRDEGKDVMAGLKGTAGVTPQMLSALQSALQSAEGGDSKQLAGLIGSMTNFLQRTKADNAELRREINELAAAMKEQRNGR